MLHITAEHQRLYEQKAGIPWNLWGTYLSERQWGTVREDYSAFGSAWDFFSHDNARSRVYRWGEDGIAGFSDNQQRFCFSLALWNAKDTILKERLFGLTGKEGNRNEDVKEVYYYTANTPTHSYCEMIYFYPTWEFPYATLVSENAKRSHLEPEFEIYDFKNWQDKAYVEIKVTYFKLNPNEWGMKVSVKNHHQKACTLDIIPQITCRNTWAWGGNINKPSLVAHKKHIRLTDIEFGDYIFATYQLSQILFTENETNATRLFGLPSSSPYVKDGFHEYIVNKRKDAVNPEAMGTKAAHRIQVELQPLQEQSFYFAFVTGLQIPELDKLQQLEQLRKEEYVAFYEACFSNHPAPHVAAQASAGLLWSKQLYQLDMERWLNGDPGQYPPPQERKKGRNHQWIHLKNNDIIIMPDTWEYPWYAAWDTVFHALAVSPIDPELAKEQMQLFLTKKYMSPDGRIPAYEWAFGDVNPPVSAWGIMQLSALFKTKGHSDHKFLQQVFRPLSLNYQWWLHTQRAHGTYVYTGGFMGLDNVSIIDRGAPLPSGYVLGQVDSTAWMAMFTLSMAQIAIEIAIHTKDQTQTSLWQQEAIYYLEHFLLIADALHHEDTGLWCETEQWYFDAVLSHSSRQFLPVYNASTYLCLGAVASISENLLQIVPDVYVFLKQKKMTHSDYVVDENGTWCLSLVPAAKMLKMCDVLFDESKFLSTYGIRSLSKAHTKPIILDLFGEKYNLQYAPGNSITENFGENSNWRGPIWFPVNYVLIVGLLQWCNYFKDNPVFQYPSGIAGSLCTLHYCVNDLKQRLLNLFLIDEKSGIIPSQQLISYPCTSENTKGPLLFYEYFNGDNGAGCGASHQTGWTALITLLSRTS